MSQIRNFSLKPICLTIIGCLSLPVHAEQSSQSNPIRLADIKVSAQKHEQNLLEVPQSLTVISGEDIDEKAINTLQDLAPHVPNFLLPSAGQDGLIAPTMRGLNAGIISFSTSLPMFIDGVPVLSAQGFENTLIDIERVEILRGPQSTLYGRNAEVGAINIYSRKPDNQTRGGVVAEFGERNRSKMQLKASGALIKDKLYLALAGDTLSQNGYIDNTAKNATEDDRKQDNARAQLRWTPGSNTEVLLTASHQKHNDGGFNAGLASSSRYKVSSNADSSNKSKVNAYSLNIQHRFANGVELEAITAQRTHQERVRQDFDFTAMPMVEIYKFHDFVRLSQEVRLQGDLNDHHWLVGLYADQDRNDLGFNRYTGMGNFLTAHDLDGHVEAIFTQWNLQLSQPWQLQLGLRYEQNHQELTDKNFGSNSKADWSHTSPKVSLSYQKDETTTYLNVAEGFRAGGYNPYSPPGLQEFDEEKLWSYELGTKGSFFDNTLDLSAAVYYMDIDKMQVQEAIPNTSNIYPTLPKPPHMEQKWPLQLIWIDGQFTVTLG